jgi:ABC-2 type transport system ATP-binding protein
MRRRLDLGASLVGRPRLLDEPTTGLDPRSRIELWDAIRTLVASGTDVLLTTQHLDEADKLASDIVIVDHGRTIATGIPAELKRRIGGQMIEIHARNRGQLATIADALQRADTTQPQIDEAIPRVTVGADAADQDLRAALRALEAANVEIDDISLRQPTLDEVFLALTGQTATDVTTDSRAAA